MAMVLPHGNEPVGFRTKGEWAYLQIRHRIQTGQLEPEERLDQDRLARELGVSRVPIRQALIRLEAEGLVTSRPHVGATVAALSLDDADDVYASRGALESMLAGVAVPKLKPGTIKRLQEVLDAQRSALNADDHDRFMRLDRVFHGELYQQSGYRHSLELVDRLRDLSVRYVGVFLHSKERALAALDEHQRILDACNRGDSEAAAVLTREHIYYGLEVMREISAQSSVPTGARREALGK
jgi:DNA-binding GntR family transcriptional regulator